MRTWSSGAVVVAVVSVFGASGCGGAGAVRAASPATSPATEPVAAPSAAAAVAPVVAPAIGIDRADLVRVLDAGLGRFLGGVDLQPVLRDGRFVGFQIVSFYPSDARLAGGPVLPGDVVVAVNGLPIERPEQAFRVWQLLRVASELRILVVRGNEQREVRYAIND